MLTLIDGNSLLFRAYYGVHGRLNRSDGTPVNAVYGFCNMVLPLLANTNPEDRFFCVFDAARKNFRNDIYPQYKANRGDTPEDLIAQIELTHEAARAMGMPVLAIMGVEADDVIATLAARECDTGKTRIVTGDKDLMQLVSPCSFLYDGMKSIEIHEAQVLEKFGVRPDQVIDVQSLMGDSSDNVPGVPGIGPKKAAELINEFNNLDKLYENLDTIKNERIRNLLKDYKDQAYISRQLVTLKADVELPEFKNEKFKFDLPTFLEFAETKLESNSLKTKATKLFANKVITIDIPQIKYEQTIIITTEQELDKFLSGINNVLAIDTETTGLDSMADKIVGISLATNSKSGAYIPIRHTEKQNDLFGTEVKNSSVSQLSLNIVKNKLWPILTNTNIIKVGHNLKYDLHILSNEGWDTNAIAPIDDTMLLSYVLHGTAHAHNLDELAKIYLDHENIKFSSLFPTKTKSKDMHFETLSVEIAAPYAAEDAWVCFGLYEIFREKLNKNEKLKKLYENCDLPLLKVLLNMERTGVMVNQSRFSTLSEIFHKDMEELEKQIWHMAGHEFNIASPQQLATVLYEEMGLPLHKSTDADTLAEIEHPIADKILEWRSLSKLAGTYTDALPHQIASDGRIHTTYLQTSTNTGRLSSRDPNLQNIPIKTKLGEEIRKCFVAPSGRVLISTDYSQIQLRLLADVADIKSFKETFARGEDIHSKTARTVFKIPDSEPVPKDLRAKAKTLNFSIIYGISAFGLANQLNISRTEAQIIIDSYLAELPEIKNYFDKTKQFALDNGCVYTPWGRRIELPEVRNPRLRAYAMRAAINAPIQGFEADLMRLAMIKISELKSSSAKMIMQVHDEIVCECDIAESLSFADQVKTTMENVAYLSVPLLAETNISTDWGK